MRPSKRAADEMRKVTLERGVVRYAEGSCMVTFGETKVLCAATVEEKGPPWLRGTGKGWVTAEYSMLPRATHERTRREVALHDALKWMEGRGLLKGANPLKDHVAAVSCGIVAGNPVIDLDYIEDSGAQTDANFVVTGKGGLVEVQGTAEGAPFSEEELMALLKLAKGGVSKLVELQKAAVA